MKKTLIFIISFCLIFSFGTQSVSAFYSPLLNTEAAQIRENLNRSKRLTGVGSFYDTYRKLIKEKANPGAENRELFLVFLNLMKQFIVNQGIANSSRSLFLNFYLWPIDADQTVPISACLRDDIWEIQILQEEVLNQLLKSALYSDSTSANQLWEDYRYLQKLIDGGGMSRGGKNIDVIGLSKSYTSNDWFPNSNLQLYTNCPYDPYRLGIDRFSQTMNRFKGLFENGLGNLSLGSFKSIPKIAQQRAILRAQEWVKANQLRFTIGGSQGANPQSLIRGPGIAGLAGDLATEGNYIKSFGSEIYNDIIRVFQERDTAVELSQFSKVYSNAQKTADLATKNMQIASQFNLSLNNVSENSLAQLEGVLVETNIIIKAGIDKKIGKQATVQNMCKLISDLAKKQCRNKAAGLNFNCQ